MARVLPGQPWKPETAAQRNRWDESAEYFALKQRLGKRLPDQRMPVPTEMDVIKVQNLTGSQRAESEVVQLGADIISNITRLHPWLEGLTPDSRCERYAVLRYPTGINRIRWAQVSGPTLALVDLTDGHKRCSPSAGLYHFVGDDDGPIEILWKPDETEGVHECLVEMEQVVPPSNYVAKLSITGIPGRIGATPGRAVCEIYKLVPHDYTGPEEKTLTPILQPNLTALTKEIYNISTSAISGSSLGEDVFIAVHREECGNWFTSNSGGDYLLAESYLDEDLCATNAVGSGSGSGSEEQVVQVRDATYLPDCIPFTPNKVTNPRNHEGPNGSKLLLVRKRCGTSGSGSGSGSGEDEEWQIFDIELRPYCAVVGLKDSDECLKSAGLKLRGEWCPAGEPTTACVVVNYIQDCGSGSGSGGCDLAWDFEPLYACCGQGSGSGA